MLDQTVWLLYYFRSDTVSYQLGAGKTGGGFQENSQGKSLKLETFHLL